MGHYGVVAFSISIDIDVNAGGVAGGLNPAIAAFNNFGTSATSALDRVKASFAGLSTGTKIFTGLGIGIGALALGLKQVIGPAIEFESAFAGVQKTVDGTPQQLESIRSGLLNLSTVLPTSASDLADIAANAGQLGVAAPDVLEFTRVIAALGETTDLDFDQASSSVARFLNITGNDVPVSALADVIVELGNNSATTESQIVDFATRLASSLTLAGASEDQILALAASFSSLGLRSEAGGTALSQVFNTLSDAVADGGPKLEAFAEVAGLLPEEFREIAATNPVEAFLLFGEGLGRMQAAGESFSPILDTLQLTGQRTGEVFRLLSLNFDQVRGSLTLANEAFTEGGAAQAELDARLNTTAARLDILKNRLENVAIAVGTPLLDTLAQGADLAGNAISELSSILAPFGAALAESFQGGVDAAGQFFSVVGGPAVNTAVIGLTVLADTATTVLGAINSLGPAGLIIAALVADIILVGPASVAAVAAMQAIAVAGGGMAGALTAANVGLQNLVAGLNPATLLLAALAAAFVFSESQVGKVDERVAAFAGTLQNDLSTAIESSDVQGFSDGLAQVSAEVERLESSQGTFDKFSLGLNEISGGFFGVSDGARETRDKIEALNQILESEQVEAYASNMGFLQNALGFTEAEVINLLESQGQLNILWDTSATRFDPLIAAVQQYTDDVTALDSAQSEAAQSIVAGTGSLEDYAEILGVTEETLTSMLGRLDGVSVEGLIGDDDVASAEAFAAALAEIVTVTEPLAAALGVSTDAIEASIAATDRLAAAYDNLEAAVSGAEPPLARLAEQQQAYADAQTALADALDGGISDQEQLAAAMELSQEATKRLASSTGDLGAALEFQDVQEDFFRQQAADIGLSDERTQELLDSFLLLSGVDLAKITLAFGDVRDSIDEANAAADELERERKVNIDGEIDNGFILEFLDELGLVPDEVKVQIFGETDNGFVLEFLDELGLIPDEVKVRAFGEADSGFVLEFLGQLGLIPQEVRVNLTAENNAGPVIDDLTSDVSGLSADWPITLSAQDNASPTIGAATIAATEFRNGTYIANIDADTAAAIAGIFDATSAGNTYKNGDYTAQMTAENGQALASAAAAAAGGRQFAGGTYQGVFTGNNAPALGAIAIAAARATAFARTYTATISASWVGGGVVAAARAAINSIPRSVTTVVRSVSGGTRFSANGGIVGYSDGGINRLLAGGVTEQPGRAQIYKPASTYRVFAERETGGEAYIPLAKAKRDSAIPVLMETAKILGVLANGGVQGYRDGGINRASIASGPEFSTVFSPSIEININGGGSPDQNRELATLTEQAVEKALDRQARRLANVRG